VAFFVVHPTREHGRAAQHEDPEGPSDFAIAMSSPRNPCLLTCSSTSFGLSAFCRYG
jgi:hypothetical protein